MQKCQVPYASKRKLHNMGIQVVIITESDTVIDLQQNPSNPNAVTK